MTVDALPGWTPERLRALEKDVHATTKRLDDGIATQQQQAKDIGEIKTTLAEMQSAEMAELRRRADFPRRLLYAVGVPLFASTVGGLILLALSGGIHVH